MKYLVISFLLGSTIYSDAQLHRKDSLLSLLSTTKEDTVKVNLLADVGYFYEINSNPDSALLAYHQGLELAKSIRYKKGEMNLQSLLGFYSWRLGDYSTAIKLGYQLLELAKLHKDTSSQINANAILFNSYRDQGDYEEALKLSTEATHLILKPKIEDCTMCGVAIASVGSVYFYMEKYDSAMFYLQKSLTYPRDFAYGWILLMTGRTWAKMNNEEVALDYFHQSIHHLLIEPNYKDLAGAYTGLANLFSKMNQPDSAIVYGKLALQLGREKEFSRELMDAYLSLSATYENINREEAFRYYKMAMELKSEIYNQEKQIQIANFKFNEELRRNEIKASEADYKNRLMLNAMLGSTFTLLVIAIFLYRNSRLKQRAKAKIEAAYNQLQATQSQLIQSEKMASLGELTAGIAHEIQNPLNFVNNFSEVNAELIEELKAESVKPKVERDEKLEKELLNIIAQNEEKINHHGKRADAIVKGMLQHSRSSSGVKEPTDINALAEEYLRLAYHGLRAKDKSFNATLNTNYDESIGNINVVPQDIGRVILNLINNAFYAVSEKQRGESGKFEPMVSVSTKKDGNKVLISVKDNGNGIPDSIKDKIFQPFFTTKPTGQGTGLGLSLCYDIVKAHGGEIKIESNKESGTSFIISLNPNI
jgi:signal transduction histidine kinase